MASRDLPASETGGQSGSDPSSPLLQVGQTLKKARESHGLSLNQLAQALHMGNEQLQALENGDRDQLAEPVFVRAAVRRVAYKLKVDPEPLILALQDLDQPKSGQASRATSRAPGRAAPAIASTATTGPTQHRPWHGLRLASGGVALLAAITASWTWSQGNWVGRTTATAPSTTNKAVTPQPKADTQNTRPPSPAAADTTITIVTIKPSWIALRNKQGEMLFEGMIDQEKTVDASNGLEIYAGRPDLVSVKRDGAAAGPLGAIDQVRWYELSATPAPPDSSL